MDSLWLSRELDRDQIAGSGLDQHVLDQMCHYEWSRQCQLRAERLERKPQETYVKGRYQELLQLWRKRDEMWPRYVASADTSIENVLKYWDIPGARMEVSGLLVVFQSDLLERHNGNPRKIRRKQTNRRLEFFMYDKRNHRRLLIATAPIARWTERRVGIALYDTLAGLSPAWLTAMTMENVYKAEILGKRLPAGRLPR